MSLVQSAHMRMKRKKERSTFAPDPASPRGDPDAPVGGWDSERPRDFFPAPSPGAADARAPPQPPAAGMRARRAYGGINSPPADDVYDGGAHHERRRRPGGASARGSAGTGPPRPRRGRDSPFGTTAPGGGGGEGEAFDPFAPSPVNLPPGGSARARATPAFPDAFPAAPSSPSPPSPRLAPTIEGSAHRFVYPDDDDGGDGADELRREPSVASGQSSTAAVAPPPALPRAADEYEYHTEPDESASLRAAASGGTAGGGEDATVDSEEAQYGTPVKKKGGGGDPPGTPVGGVGGGALLTEITTKKKRRRHPRGAPRRDGAPSSPSSPRGSGAGDVPPSPSPSRFSPGGTAASHFSPGGIAAHAKRFTSRADEPSPQRVGSSRSYDEGAADAGPGWWGDGGPFGTAAAASSRRESRSWDEDGAGFGGSNTPWDPPASAPWDPKLGTAGTWGSDDKAAAFGVAAGGGGEESTKDSTPSSDVRLSPPFRDDPAADREALAEWDRAEAIWRSESPFRAPKHSENAFAGGGTSSSGRARPWNDPDADERGAPRGGKGGGKGGEVTPQSDGGSDDDSIFEFDGGPSPASGIQLPSLVDRGGGDDTASASAIFDKINSGLKEADKARKSISSPRQGDDGGDGGDVDDGGPVSPSGRVAFAGEGENTVHTYVVPPDRVPSRDDDDGDGDDIGIDVVGRSAARRAALSDKIQGEAGGTSSRRGRGGSSAGGNSADDGSAADDTYGDSTLDTGGSTYRSEADAGAARDGDGGPTLLDHVGGAVGGAAAALALAVGGLLAATSPVGGGGGEEGEDDGASAVAGGGTVDDATADRVEESRARMMRPGSPRSDDGESDDGGGGSDGEDTYGQMTAQSTTHSTFSGRNGDGSTADGGDWLGYMEKLLFPGKERDSQSNTWSESSAANQDEEDGYLLQQALAAARAVHHVQGVEYNESQAINVLTDVKFVVVTVSLPLGLLFREHEIGCWVSKVVPDGNGGRGGVQQGDQLAAIDGRSAVHANIDEAASAISECGKGGAGVELTFLRYVGPLRPVPGSVIQEGFEVTGKRALKSQKRGRRRGFGKSSSRGGGKKPGKSSRGFFKGRRGSSKAPPSPGARSSAAGYTSPPPSPARGGAAATPQSTPDRARASSKGAKGKSIRNILRRGKK